MLTTGPAKKVTVYVMEGQTYHGTACYAAILDYLFFRGISDATVTRGVAGFGTDHKLHTSRLVDLADQMPIKIEFHRESGSGAGGPAQAGGDGVPRNHRGSRYDRDQAGAAGEEASSRRCRQSKLQSQAKMMRILIGEHDKWNGKPLHEALVQALRANDIAGVTVYRGILGYGANRRMHKDSTLNLSHDAPILLRWSIARRSCAPFSPSWTRWCKQGLVVLSDVDVIKYSHAQPLPGRRRRRNETRRQGQDAAHSLRRG